MRTAADLVPHRPPVRLIEHLLEVHAIGSGQLKLWLNPSHDSSSHLTFQTFKQPLM
jgi:hypothetical protein